MKSLSQSCISIINFILLFVTMNSYQLQCLLVFFTYTSGYSVKHHLNFVLMTAAYENHCRKRPPSVTYTFFAFRGCPYTRASTVYMLWFNFILGLIFIFLCFKLIIIYYHTQRQRKIKIKPRIKLNHNIYITSVEDPPRGQGHVDTCTHVRS